MWIPYALIAAFFAGCTSVLAKIGIRNTDSNLATALRTIIVAAFAWLMVFIVGSQNSITEIGVKSLVFLILSGLSTGGSWLCYFRALKIGDVNKVVPIDKSSTVLTVILSFIILGESMNWLKAIAIIMIGAGTYFMIERRSEGADSKKGRKWLVYASLSAVFASLTAIFGKVGIEGVESNLGTAIRTVIVLAMAWLVVIGNGKQREITGIDKRSWWFIGLSGLATGFSWLCFYRALQEGPVSVVVPIDKLSILITISFSYFILGERLSKWSLLGLAFISLGTVGMALI